MLGNRLDVRLRKEGIWVSFCLCCVCVLMRNDRVQLVNLYMQDLDNFDGVRRINQSLLITLLMVKK